MIYLYIATTIYLFIALVVYGFLMYVASEESDDCDMDASELFAIDPRVGLIPTWLLMLAVAVTWPYWIWSARFTKDD